MFVACLNSSLVSNDLLCAGYRAFLKIALFVGRTAPSARPDLAGVLASANDLV